MKSLTYFSSQTRPFSDAELERLLDHATLGNARHDITGILLYHNGNFLQLIEGPDQEVDDLYQRIQADPRHGSFKVIDEHSIVHRQFSEWEMRFANLGTGAPDKLPASVAFRSTLNSLSAEAALQVQQLIELFATAA